MTDFDLLHVLKEHIIDYADSTVRIKCTTDKGILDGFKARMTDARTAEFKTCKHLLLVVYLLIGTCKVPSSYNELNTYLKVTIFVRLVCML